MKKTRYRRGIRIYQYRDCEVAAYNKEDAVRVLNKKYGLNLKPLLSSTYKDLVLISSESWKKSEEKENVKKFVDRTL
jgi:hypothetical protein